MFVRTSCAMLVAITCLWLVAPVSADTVSYQYIYDTTDGAGAGAYQPQTSGGPADSTHSASYATYSSGELNDGVSYVGTYTDGYWGTGNQVGTKNPDYPTSKTAPSIVAKLDQSQSWNLGTISVNYVVDFRPGIHAPSSATVYFSFDGASWSSGTSVDGWIDANPSKTPPYDDGGAISDLYMNNIDVSGIGAAHGCKYVRLDIGTTREWGGLVEVGFAGTPIPEPSSFVLISASIIGILAYAWRKRR